MTPAQRQAANHGFRTNPTPIVTPGLTRGPAAFPATGNPTMTKDEAVEMGRKLYAAYQADDETNGSEAAIGLLIGIAVNVAIIAAALTPSPPSG